MARFSDIVLVCIVLGGLFWGLPFTVTSLAGLPVFQQANITGSGPVFITTTATWFFPQLSVSFFLFVFLLVVTLDTLYFPTTPVLVTYVVIMVQQGKFPIPVTVVDWIWFALVIAAYLVAGFGWLFVKWWSILEDDQNEHTIANLRDGGGQAYFLQNLRRLYPHFLYWPLSVPYTILTKFGFQLFSAISRKFGGIFGRMAEARRDEILKSRTPKQQRTQ